MLAGPTVLMLVQTPDAPIQELVGRRNMLVPSWDTEQGVSIPGLLLSVYRAAKPACTVAVTWANTINDQFTSTYTVVCTPDHRWVLRDGVYRKACSLAPGDLLLPVLQHPTWGEHQVVNVVDNGSQVVYSVNMNQSFLGYGMNYALADWVYVQEGGQVPQDD